MAFVDAGVALARSKISFGGTADSPSIDPWALAFGDGGESEPRRFPEIDCLRSALAPGTLAAAEDRAAALAVGADRVLIAAGTLSEETYLRALGEHLGVAFEPLDAIPRALCPIGNERLCIDNTADGWLARLFTAEYAGQFDVFLPGIATLGLPLPLGGSSNHIRTASLREIGGWDAYNVTEDADLGTRLARFGYRVGVIPSTTYEEAPARIGAWLRQRTRWFKGWMRPVNGYLNLIIATA